MRLELALPEAYVGKTAIGDTVRFTAMAHLGTVFFGTVSRRSQSISPGSRTEIIEADVQNAGKKLQAGLFVKAVIPFGVEGVWAVPRKAVMTTMEDRFVLRLKNGKTEKVSVETGLENKTHVQVMGQLAIGDSIVVNAREFY